MKKFWVIHNIPSPYRLHIFNALYNECKRRDLDFHVHFMSDMRRGYDERPLSWRNPKMDFPYTYWRDYGLGQRHVNPGLLLYLWKNKPDYLLVGSPFDTFTGMFAGRMTNGITCTWCEGNTKTPGRLNGLIGAIKRFSLRGYKYVAVPGKDAIKYIELHQKLTKHIMPKTIILPNLVDETRFTHKDWNASKDEVKHAIIPARLKPVKGLMEFVNILSPEMLSGWKIQIVGDGELKTPLENLILKRSLKDFIEINPFISYEEMPNYYVKSDLLILPSIYDPNPLSVIEALHTGLPIALSDKAGNIEEGVEEGKNGWKLPVGNSDKFVEILKEIFSCSREKLAIMGKWSYEHNAKFWSTDKSISNFCDILINEKN